MKHRAVKHGTVVMGIGATAVDASDAPILFANSVGGYLPSSVADATGIGASGMPTGGMPGGGTPTGSPSASASAPGANGNTNGTGGALNTNQLLAPAAAAAALGDEVNHLYYWDEGHGANADPGDFIAWIAKVTGHKARRQACGVGTIAVPPQPGVLRHRPHPLLLHP
ncbi:hypothetical protein [Streptomyces puniciscabiei]|uniref:hypothetical protein n=1 Tax=Streptomyces puniciscabiei TaxID=164348 RepID=UPI00379AD116